MTLNIGVSDSWEKVNKVFIGVGNSWKSVNKKFIGKDGVWQEVFTSLLVSLSGGLVSTTSSFTANAQWKFNADGTLYKRAGFTETLHETWLTDGDASDAEVRVTHTSGSTPSGGSISTWLPASNDYIWSLTRSTVGTSTTTLLFEIRHKDTLEILDSGTYTISVTVEEDPF